MSLRSILAVLTATAACSNIGAPPRYVLEIFSEDTMPAHVTINVSGPMQVSLNGSGFYTYRGKPVVLTPASLVVRGSGSATISTVDSAKPLAIVPSGTHPDSTDAVVKVGRLLRVSRAEGEPGYKVEVQRQ